MSLTAPDIAALFATLEAGGLRPPDGFGDREVYRRALTLWLDVLDDTSRAELDAACVEYLRSPDPADRWWPTPGTLLARTPLARLAASLGSDTDTDTAWSEFAKRMRLVLHSRNRPCRGEPERELDTSDADRNAAMWSGLEAIGGATGFYEAPPEHPERDRWKRAYAATRREQARRPEVVRALAVTRNRAQLPAAEAK